jgi:phosphoribosylanthranilate isomerase
LRVKICGITSVRDAMAAVDAGADGIGLNFYGGPRRIEIATAASILEALPPMVTPVALVRLEEGGLTDSLAGLLARYQVSLLQAYGDLNADQMVRLSMSGFSVVPVLAVRDQDFAASVPVWDRESLEWRPKAVVLDTYDQNRAGGTGKAFRWDWVEQARATGRLDGWPPVILAGGLNPDNVAEAIRVVRPFAVDVSSGVELEGAPGRKDPDKMRAFVRSARSAFERNAE